MTRTDIHRPAEVQTDNYEFTGAVIDEAAEWPAANAAAKEIVRSYTDAGYRFSGVYSRGNCSHCGAALRYAALLVHTPSSTLLYVGEQCLENRFEQATELFQQARQAAAQEAARKRKAGEQNAKKQRIQAGIAKLVEQCPYVADLTYDETAFPFVNDFLLSLSHQLRTKGSLSTKQLNAVKRLFEKHIQRENEKAEQRKTADTLPEGRQTVTGTIVKVDVRDNPYGGIREVCVIRDDRGWAVWGTIPKSLLHNGRGALKDVRVTFDAQLTQSDHDDTFGFFKQPTQAKKL